MEIIGKAYLSKNYTILLISERFCIANNQIQYYSITTRWYRKTFGQTIITTFSTITNEIVIHDEFKQV